MATQRATSAGNWNTAGTWASGQVPQNGDTVYANGYAVTIDEAVTIGGANNPTVASAALVAGQWYQINFVGTSSWTNIGAANNNTNTVFLATGTTAGTGTAKALATISTLANASAGAAAGGSFTIDSARSFSCDVRAGSTVCLTITGSSSPTYTGVNIYGGNVANAHGILNNSTGTVTFNGYIVGGSMSGSYANGIYHNTNGTITLNGGTISSVGTTGAGGVFNGSAGTVNLNSCIFNQSSGVSGVTNNATGTVNIVGGTLNGSSGGAACAYNAALGTLNVSGAVLNGGTSSSGQAVINYSNGAMTLTGNTYNASAYCAAVSGTSATANVTISGNQNDHVSGVKAVYVAKYKLGTAPSQLVIRTALDGSSTYFSFYGADYSGFGHPAVTDVRAGTLYAANNLTGTLAVPSASNVALGIAVDNTVGAAVLTDSAVAAAVWAASNRTLTGLSVPSAADIAAAVWSSTTRTITTPIPSTSDVDTLLSANHGTGAWGNRMI